MLKVLDPAHQGSVTSLGLKTVLTVFCRARLREKLVYLFREHSHKVINHIFMMIKTACSNVIFK